MQRAVPALLSSHSALIFSIGVCLTLMLLHLTRSGRTRPADRSVAIWAALSAVFAAARWIEIHTDSPEVAVSASRVMVAVGPLQICTIVAFVRWTTGNTIADREGVCFVAANATISVLALTTAWFIQPTAGVGVDPFGRVHHLGLAAPGMVTVALELPLILAWMARDISRTEILEQREKVMLLGPLAAYATMAMMSVASGAGVANIPSLAEYGPVVMAFGLTSLVNAKRSQLATEREQLLADRTRALSQSQERYREVLELAPVSIFVVRPDGSLEVMNPKTVELVGAPSNEAALEINLLGSEPLARAGIVAAIRGCFESGEPTSGEFRIVTRWDRRIDIQLQLRSIETDSGETRVLGVVQDLTERLALEKQLRQSQKMDSVGQLAAGIAHEINNPMAFVRANLGVLRSDWDELRKDCVGGVPLDDPRWGDFEEIIDESLEGIDRTVAIAKDMREFAHSGDEERTRIDLHPVLEASVRVAGTHRNGGTRFETDYSGLPPVRVSAGQIQQVFVNLLVNALQAVPSDGIVRIATARSDGNAVIAIEDNGPGIAEQHLERLFDPFFSTKEAGSGTGLGLYISYQIIESHGGELAVGRSSLGGARFEVRLPASAR